MSSNRRELETEKVTHLFCVANSPSPNMVELYNNIAKRRDIDLEVAYLSINNKKWRGIKIPLAHKATTFRNLSPISSQLNTAFCPGIFLRILRLRRDAKIIVFGYSNPTNFLLIFMLALFFRNRNWAFRGERMKRSNRMDFFTRGVKRLVVMSISKASRVYAVGQTGLESYEEYGVPRRLLKNLPYTKDFSVYQSAIKTCDNKVIVTTARLVPSKKIDQLIRVFSDLSDDYPKWRLHIIGDGEMRAKLEMGVKESLRGRITFYGFAEPKTQAEIYAGADIFVLPSMHDGWGMVVPEAMAAGLPVITTDEVIAGRDLVRNGENGFLLPAGRDELLAAILRRVMSGDLDLKKMGENALDSVSAYYPDQVSNDLVTDISSAWRCRK